MGEGKITVWANIGSRPDEPLTASWPQFTAKIFAAGNANRIPSYLSQCLDTAAVLERTLIVVFEIESDASALVAALSRELPGFDTEDLRHVCLQSVGHGSVVLPHARCNNDLSNVMAHPMVKGHSFQDGASSGTETKLAHLESVSIGTIICSGSILQGLPPETETEQANNAILLVCTSPQVVLRLERHLHTPYEYRQERINRNPMWIYMDLVYLFSDWKDVWDSARCRLAGHDHAAYSTSTSSAQALNRALHKEISGIYVLQEHLRLHISALRKFQSIALARASPDQEELESRIEDYLADLFHHHDTSEVILKQLRILVDLLGQTVVIWNSEAAEHVQWLLLVFVPLIFVTTLFSMTTISVPSYWYPLVAFLVVSLVMSILILTEPIRRAFGFLSKRTSKPTSKPTFSNPRQSPKVSNVNEKDFAGFSGPNRTPSSSATISRPNMPSPASDGFRFIRDSHHFEPPSLPPADSPPYPRFSYSPPMSFQPAHFSDDPQDQIHRAVAVRIHSPPTTRYSNPPAEPPRVYVPADETQPSLLPDDRPLTQATYFPRSPASQSPPMPEVVPASSSSSEASVTVPGNK